MRLLGTKLAANSSHRGFGDQLYDAAGERPSLDLRFADNKSLVDATTGQNLVTFTRASSGTYVGSDGLIKTATTNLLLQSADISNAYWVKSETTVTANSITAPDGTLTAGKLVETTSNGQHTLASASISWAGNSQYTATFYAKSGERFCFDILLGTGANWVNTERVATFNLSTGTVLFSPNSPATASIQAVGSGWYRCRVTATTVAAPSASSVFIRMADNTGLASYQGIAGYGIYLWGAQLEQSSTVGEYVPTTSTINSAPRFDHNPTTGESLGLLVEEARTNLLLYSEQLDNGAWGPVRGTVTANATTSPAGTAAADKLIMANGGADGQYHQGATITSGATVTGSIYIKEAGADRFQIVLLSSINTTPYGRATFNTSTGAITSAAEALNGASGASASATAVGNGWYRCVVTVTYPAVTSAGMRLNVTMADGSNGDGVKGVFAWGAQLEAGAFPTSYIPTTTAAATRSADVASISGSNFSSWYRQDEGTVFAETQLPAGSASNVSSRSIIDVTDGTTSNRFSLRGLVSTTTVDQLTVRSGGSTVAQVSSNGSAVSNAVRRLASAVKLDDYAIAATGSSSAVTDISGAMPISVNQARIGAEVGSTEVFCGTIRRLVYWPQRFANSTLQTITQ